MKNFLKIKRVLKKEGLKGIFQRILQRILNPFSFLFLPSEILKIKSLKKKSKREILNIVLNDSFLNLVSAMQIQREISQLLAILAGL